MKTRRFIEFLFLLLAPFLSLYSRDTTLTSWQSEFSFNPDFIASGYVQVREFSNEGTKLSLDKDLGITLTAGVRF
jgi:hypothetical protein